MKRWLFKTRRRAERTGVLHTSEFAIGPWNVIDATSEHVIFNAYDGVNKIGHRQKFDRAEVEQIHAALGLWLNTGKLA